MSTPVYDALAQHYAGKTGATRSGRKRNEMVRVYGGQYKDSLVMYVRKGAMSFKSRGIEYVRTNQRDGIDLPVFVRAEEANRYRCTCKEDVVCGACMTGAVVPGGQ